MEQRAVGAAVAPSTVHQTWPHPTGRPPSVTPVAVHRAEERPSRGGRRPVSREGVPHARRRRCDASGEDVCFVKNGGWHPCRRCAGVRGATRGGRYEGE